MYVGDNDIQRIRRVTVAGVVSILVGSTAGFVETTAPVVMPSTVYSGAALSFTDIGLVAGTSYTYTVTAVGPGTVSNMIGPFGP